MNENIIQFLQQQTCATICCVDNDGLPYCFSCFYVFNKETYSLYFKSSKDSNHSILLAKNPAVAGTILPDKLNKLIVKGIQFTGELSNENEPLAKDTATKYYFKFPAALAVNGQIYTIQLNGIKLTDSSTMFGKKIVWRRQEYPVLSKVPVNE